MTTTSVEDDIARGFVAEFPDQMVGALPGQIATGEVTMLVAESNDEDNRPLGIVGIGWRGSQREDIRELTGDRVNIAFLSVPEESDRGRGIGTALMQEAITTINEDTQGRGVRGMCLAVEVNPPHPELGNRSIRIYERLGFVALGEPIHTVREGEETWLQAMILPRNASDLPTGPTIQPGWFSHGPQ